MSTTSHQVAPSEEFEFNLINVLYNKPNLVTYFKDCDQLLKSLDSESLCVWGWGCFLSLDVITGVLLTYHPS